jgi:hypothetical protein
MLLKRPWLKDAKDWGNNIVSIEGNEMVITMVVTKHLGAEVKIL